jgi:hypothetical protein
LRIAYKQTAQILLCFSLASLIGCATTSELEELRAEVAKANAIAVRATADLAKTQKELASLKAVTAVVESSAISSMQRKPPPASSARPRGYKWGRQDP